MLVLKRQDLDRITLCIRIYRSSVGEKKNLICNAHSTLTHSWKNKPKVMILKNLGLRACLQRCIPVMCTGCAALGTLLPPTWDPRPVLALTASEARRGEGRKTAAGVHVHAQEEQHRVERAAYCCLFFLEELIIIK